MIQDIINYKETEPIKNLGSNRGVVVKVLYWNFVVSEFEL